MVCDLIKERRVVAWSSPSNGVWKFNVDEAAPEKLDFLGIGEVFLNYKGNIFCIISLNM